MGSSSAPGRYLVSYLPGHPGYEPGDSDFAGYIHLPTPYGAIYLRIQVNGPDDVSNVTALQTQFVLTSGLAHHHIAPQLTKSLLSDNLPTNVPEKILQLTARLSSFCLPEVASDIPFVTATLRMAGLSRGFYSPPSGVNLPSAAAAAIAKVAAVRHADSSEYFMDLGNQWSRLKDKYSGDFKSYYVVRAFVAAQGYLQLTSDQAQYPFYDVTGTLTSDASYTLTFSRKPPVKGFWSIMVYDQKAYLIDNPWNIYSVGDRSGIKYQDGSLVYRPDSPDKEFTILLQSMDYPPPDCYQSK